MKKRNRSKSQNPICRVCTLVAASLILPALVYADHDNGNVGEHHWRGDNDEHHEDPRISAVPEANTGIVLIPYVGAILLFSVRQLFRAKATE